MSNKVYRHAHVFACQLRSVPLIPKLLLVGKVGERAGLPPVLFAAGVEFTVCSSFLRESRRAITPRWCVRAHS